jgi:hypothetical protein
LSAPNIPTPTAQGISGSLFENKAGLARKETRASPRSKLERNSSGEGCSRWKAGRFQPAYGQVFSQLSSSRCFRIRLNPSFLEARQ